MPSILSAIRQRLFQKQISDICDDSARYSFYSEFIGPSDLTFDIGANRGNRTRVFANIGRMVVAVEPQDSCMKLLKAEFGRNPKVKLVKKAVGSREGSAEIMVSNANTLSSLSPEWVDAVRNSGRFSDYAWERKERVEVTTLDILIQTFGVPTFIKIDVEGYEFQALSGLSVPIRTVSFEFVPEYLEAAFKCIDRLLSIGRFRFNYSVGESMRMALDEWVSREAILALLSRHADDRTLFADVYAHSD
jgi:FkbM family methyltransferase